MSFTLQPNPESYLEQLVHETRGRGILKVYLGYAAGVGKTYAMLSNAHRLKDEENREVVVGLVESHGRAGTQDLVDGLEVLPQKTVDYRDRTLWEFDLEAALERNPEILLVDELAHTNLGEVRHPKRWGDILELLDAGIEVHTTLNVQHLESVADLVGHLARVKVGEIVPDHVLERAQEIVLVDLTPEELLLRLNAGKVYPLDQVEGAKSGFFQKTHLLALRELAMRKAAHHVDEGARSYLRRQSLSGPWPAGERLLVCVGPSPSSETLVKATKRLAENLSGTWIALHVDTGGLSPGEHERVDRHLQLARRLGAEVLTVTSLTVPDKVVEIAAQKNVTKLVSGKSLSRPQSNWRLSSTFNDKLLRESKGIDLLILGTDEDPESPEIPAPSSPKSFYWRATGFVVLAGLLGYPLVDFINPTNLVMLFLAAVVATAVFYGRGPSGWASVLSVLVFDFFFVPPQWTFEVADLSYAITFFGLLSTGLVVSHLAAAATDQARAAKVRADDALVLLALSRDLARAAGREAIKNVASRSLEQAFGEGFLLLPDENDRLEVGELSQREVAVADRTYRTQSAAGIGTETLPSARHQWHPLKGPTLVLGVVGLTHPVALGAGRREELLESMLHQIASAFERESLVRAAEEAHLLQASDRLQKALLNSLSHDLRIPLVSIRGALTSLQEPEMILDETRRTTLVDNALSETERLNRLVGNLLQRTRMETGHLKVHRLPCDVEDLVSTTLSSLGLRLADRRVELVGVSDVPLISMDYVLIQQVLTNLLENACAYSAPDTPIEIAATMEGRTLRLAVKDRGSGIDDPHPERLFAQFERGTTVGSGIGLGLSICKGLVEAHGGAIEARKRSGGGSEFSFTLPEGVADHGN